MMVYETPDDLVVVDCGVHFPGVDEPGIRWIIPDPSYIEKRRHKLRAILITHGHEDHIGALPYLLPRIEAPVYATAFTRMLIENRFLERAARVTLVPFEDNVPVRIGGITVHPLPVTHSIPGAVALALETAAGVIVHTGDFKIESAPLDGRAMDIDGLRAFGDRGVTALFSDSTNAMRPGHTWGEAEVADVLDSLVASCDVRLLVTTFSSNVYRLQSILQTARRHGRRVFPVGRSVEQMIRLCQQRGLLEVPSGLLCERIDAVPRSRCLVVAAGCQGEAGSALGKIARRAPGYDFLEAGDWAVFSSRRIPGNEMSVGRAADGLARQGVRVIDDRDARVHASGHALQDEQRRMLALCRPRHFVPMHGGIRQLQAHAALGREAGADTHLIEDGHPIEFQDGAARRLAPVEAGNLYVDGHAWADAVVLRDRVVLRDVGFVAVTLVLKHGKLRTAPQVVTRGVLNCDAGGDELEALQSLASDIAARYGNVDAETLARRVRSAVRRFFRDGRGTRPLVLVNAVSL
jgi:ribonuclease J